ELITVIDCICSDGTVLPPFIIMKGAPFFAASPNGWTDSELHVEWMKRVYEPFTRERAAGEWRALIFDNHEAHLSYWGKVPLLCMARYKALYCIFHFII
ncbi:hypothetical protein K435DRAFT_654021, partial [Dendrothele bispora CBS 962.96]